ncbi:hypothetical protein Pcinc_024089 [Petrolisthes cinctipes]|uniref:Cytochrome P450 n=1 Tax=Petrolisthes cinctipes TaxID=88211 RepID=A0AAE1FDJ7_PETCI|nr:hypothetical protein Pcinc_024089 [Petrolisthes cinctipes]
MRRARTVIHQLLNRGAAATSKMLGGVSVCVLVVALVAAAAYLYSRWRHNYWAARGINTPPTLPFLGHIHKMMNMEPGRFLFDYEVYSKYGGSNYCGLYEFHKPTVFVGNTELMKHIFVKDFDHFTDRRTFEFYSERDKLISEMLSVKNGKEWKVLRSIMSPIFSSGKIKSMFSLVTQVADTLVTYSLEQASKQPHVEIKDNFGRFTMDTIATCAFGINCNSFANKNAEFAKNADDFFTYGPLKIFKLIIAMFFPKMFKIFNFSFNGPELDFFKNVADQTLSIRKTGNKRGDFLDLLLEERTFDNKENSTNKQALSDRSIVSQSILFLVAGYDTTASTLSFCSYELAKNPREQQRLRNELIDVMKENNGELTYQGIMEAKLLNACLNESLRMYPPLSTAERVCVKPYQLPGTNIHLKPGDIVQLPIWCVQHDPKYWPEPDTFRPDRFMPENKNQIHSYTHMPFGMGPRNCIAMRFALMEAKVALAKMVLAAEMSLANKDEELKLVTGGGVMRPKNGIKLILRPINQQ